MRESSTQERDAELGYAGAADTAASIGGTLISTTNSLGEVYGPHLHPEVDGDACLIVTMIPALRAFARTFNRNPDGADDLVQDTLMKAIANIDKFEPGSRMKSWLFTIMRNTFYTQVKARRREAPGAVDDAASRLHVEASQEWSSKARELGEAIQALPPQQREVLVLIGVLGVSYEEAADICGCAIGTVKSRLNRARANLLEEMGEKTAQSLVENQAVLSGEYFVGQSQI